MILHYIETYAQYLWMEYIAMLVQDAKKQYTQAKITKNKLEFVLSSSVMASDGNMH